MSKRARGSRLSPVDAAWLRMDAPTNPMVITAVLGLDGPVAHAELEAMVRDRLLEDERFHLKPTPRGPLGYPVWEEDAHFDLRNHVKRVGLPAPADKAQVEALVSDLMSTPLDKERPHWQLHHLEGHAEGSILVARVHHSLGDGVGLVKLLLSLTDESAEGALRRPPQEVGVPVAPAPRDLWGRVGELATQVQVVTKLLTLPAERPNPFKGPLGIRKAAAWSSALDLDAVKGAAKEAGVSLNDLMLAAATGALRRYGQAQGRVVRDGIRALVPVYLKDPASPRRSNQIGLVYVPLPLETADLWARLRTLKAEMDRIKESAEARVALGVIGLMGLANAATERLGVEIFTQKATLLVTNVPGPREPVHLAGTALRDLMVWAPVSGRVGLGVSILSYAGRIRVGISSDARLIPEPRAIVTHFEEELAALGATGEPSPS